ncbi:MAG: hypothetical protein P4M00_13325 [Azospirillaceae bacterium]|nr:hypothetical protein [Azospirillaceae bacterium]
MNIASAFGPFGLPEIKALLDGGTLTVYSVARPFSADLPVDRSGVLATFTFASPAFGDAVDGFETPLFVANPVAASSVGTPGFARARRADGTVVADFSAGPGDREIKFGEVSCSNGAPVRLTRFRFIAEGGWPEQPDYYDSRPRPGFPLPQSL